MENNVMVANAMFGKQPTDPNLPANTDPGDGTKPAPAINNNIRQAWNDYISWLDKKGLKGNPALDHNDLGGQMIDQYRKEHPGTPLTRQMIVPIQQDFSNYRNFMLDQIKQGKAVFAPGTNKDNFMKSLSIVDGIPGQRTTSFSYPESYMNTVQNGKILKTEDQGFATAKP